MSSVKKIYAVITWWKHGDANINNETDDLEEAKEIAKTLAKDDPNDAHTFITTIDEWEEGNYEEIAFE